MYKGNTSTWCHEASKIGLCCDKFPVKTTASQRLGHEPQMQSNHWTCWTAIGHESPRDMLIPHQWVINVVMARFSNSTFSSCHDLRRPGAAAHARIIFLKQFGREFFMDIWLLLEGVKFYNMVAHNCHGKTKNLTANTKYLTAKPKTSRQIKTKYFTAKSK